MIKFTKKIGRVVTGKLLKIPPVFPKGPSKKEIMEFLSESNAIEGVYDDASLKQAKLAWDYLMKQDALTVDVVLKTHKILMKDKLFPDERGYFRKCEVRIGYRYGLNYSLVPGAIWKWCFETMRAHPKVDAVRLHVEYEKIHPFVDGNGRTGRMFLNWTRLKRTGEELIIIKEAERYSYYRWFRI